MGFDLIKLTELTYTKSLSVRFSDVSMRSCTSTANTITNLLFVTKSMDQVIKNPTN
jgi:hypothetical protein